MAGWILVIVLYLLGMGLFHLLGGLGAAGEWFERWGETSATRRRQGRGRVTPRTRSSGS